MADDKKLSKELVIYNNPKSVISESIRTLRTNIEFSLATTDNKIIMVTSSIPGEGKSFISANLSGAFSLINKKVLLVDCDLRKGRLHKCFDISNEKGLSNLLIDDLKNYKKYIAVNVMDNLSVLPIGVIPPNPSELLGSEKATKLFETLRKQYDLIILDCPPVSAVADALVLSKIADEAVLVCAQKQTPMDELITSKKSLEACEIKISGIIMNKIEKRSRKYYYDKYYY